MLPACSFSLAPCFSAGPGQVKFAHSARPALYIVAIGEPVFFIFISGTSINFVMLLVAILHAQKKILSNGEDHV